MTARAAVSAAALVAWVAAAAGCGEEEEVGNRCPEMRAATVVTGEGQDAGGTEVMRREYSVAVEKNAAFPCESAICVSTPGREPYCSRACDGGGDCPEGFACRALLELGAAGDARYCVWRECNRDADCGEDRVCSPVPGIEAGGSVEICGPR